MLMGRDQSTFREGALIRSEVGGVFGYADLHPWPELGDEPLFDQLNGLAASNPPALAMRSLDCAQRDRAARAGGLSLFDGLTIPKSHCSLPNGFSPEAISQAKAEGYETVKLKAWDFSARNLDLFRSCGLKFRLDFNAKLAFGEVVARLKSWGPDLSWLDYLEDPCPYDGQRWQELRDRFGVKLALDFEEPDGEAYDFVVWKPARESLSEVLGRLPKPGNLVVTSYLDHPVGQSFAAYRAAFGSTPVSTCGLVTHEVYLETPYSHRLGVTNGVLVPSPGTGIGFDDELADEHWMALERL